MSSLCVVSVWSLKILSNHYAMIIPKKINSFLVSSTTQSAFKNFPVFPKMSVLQLIWVLGFFLNIIYVYTVCYSLCASYNIPLKSEMDIIEFILQLSGKRERAWRRSWWLVEPGPAPASSLLRTGGLVVAFPGPLRELSAVLWRVRLASGFILGLSFPLHLLSEIPV